MGRAHTLKPDPFVSLSSLFDAVHGSIDFRDSSKTEGLDVVLRLLGAPMMDRLRRIKQLAYASHSYPSADHTRFAHAIGTLHVMRVMLRHLAAVDGLPRNLFRDLSSCFRKGFRGAKASDGERARFTQHMLSAALLQDVGELPYGNATKQVYRPSAEMKRRVAAVTDCDVSTWTRKDIFTIAAVHEARNADYVAELDLELLTFLITGNLPGNGPVPPALRAIRHIVDGVIDADRLDYVYRDAHHTVGSRGSPTSVIDALRLYDEHGPVFSDPVPISEFLATRALLWTNVYLAPQNRFRTLLLTTLLQGIAEQGECAQQFFGGDSCGELSPDEFLELDDVTLTTRIRDFHEAKGAAHARLRSRLNGRAQTALGVLLGSAPPYECVWLSPPAKPPKKSAVPAVPDDLFFDTYSDYQDHSLYEPGTVRIHSDRFQHIGSPIPLENCSGPFNTMLRGRWSALPMPGTVLLFMPARLRERTPSRLKAAISDGSLYEALATVDPLDSAEFVTDTREEKGFRGPPIFISFQWDDLKIVESIASALRTRRRQYFLLGKRYQGLGGTPGENSIMCVEEAGAVFILASGPYVNRYQTNPNGNIAKELYTMARRLDDDLPIIVLSADPFRDVSSFPSSLLRMSETPFVGAPLRSAPQKTVEEAIDAALKKIDASYKDPLAK